MIALILFPVFGVPLRDGFPATQEDIDTTNFVIDYVKNFVYNGEVSWPAYVQQTSGEFFPSNYLIKSGNLANATIPDSRYSYCEAWKKIVFKQGFLP